MFGRKRKGSKQKKITYKPALVHSHWFSVSDMLTSYFAVHIQFYVWLLLLSTSSHEATVMAFHNQYLIASGLG